jgi:hypothetical protein
MKAVEFEKGSAAFAFLRRLIIRRGRVVLSFFQTGGECAIGLIAEGQGIDMSGHFKLGMIA